MELVSRRVWSHRVGLAWAGLLLLVAASYATALPSVTSDSRLSTLVSLSILHQRNVDLDEYGTAIDQTQPYLSTRSGGHIVSVYPYGGPLLAVPLIALADLGAGLSGPNLDEQARAGKISGGVEFWAAAIIAYVSVLLIAFTLRRMHDYHTSVVIAIVVVLLVIVVVLGFWRRLLQPGSGVVLLLIAVAFLVTLPHPNRKSRFLEQPMPVVWIAAGAGASVLVDQLTGRRSWAAAAVVVAVVGAQVPSAFAEARAAEGGVQRDRPSALALADSFLPQLAHAQAPAIVSNIPMRFFTRWTYQLAFDRSTRPVTEIPGFDPTRSTNANSAALHRWLQSGAVDTLVLVDVTPGSPWFVLAPATDGLGALPDLLDAQSDFVERAPRDRWRHG